ncbi:hypothetical protein N865_19025 [Intrasporangium oryzae NRRL B-24470]|uniref:DUF2630 domain-containing protein n=1 Tax=Intrasporangium oryzae NRRL B-24470 TaxID=1386089 RepID=W9GHE5_9MICO|nr:DUF2630 family protein [Intrasporangium oryzae]EWT03314.1 hypothetical protein N865_19025 [Intrasporangium oryzae NRRL B-24470]
MAEDVPIQHHIKALIDEEHQLRAALQDGSISADEEQSRLKRVEVELDQCWDLLRQRRAKREFGGDPDEAQVRAPGIVEGYTG